MEAASSAVGIASLGIQLCQGLLSYYNAWKDYKDDISHTYQSIADLTGIFELIRDTLNGSNPKPKTTDKVQECLNHCVDGIAKLEKKLEKLRKHNTPSTLREKAWTEVQRSSYPFRASNLAKLRETAEEMQGHLSLAVQMLQLDMQRASESGLARIEAQGTTHSRLLHDIRAQNQTLAAQNQTLSKNLTTQHHALTEDVKDLSAAEKAASFQKLREWLSPSDPWTQHNAARRLHHARTGDWLLQSCVYKNLQSSQSGIIWLHGSAGCGKTVLCSTIIEDVRRTCDAATNSGYAAFYFSFSERSTHTFKDFLHSLVSQICVRDPGRTKLQQLYDVPNRSLPTLDVLESILISTIQAYDETWVCIDAIDECPDDNTERQQVLDCLKRLMNTARGLKLVATSRDLPHIRKSMSECGAEMLAAEEATVDADIHDYVADELARHPKLAGLDADTRTLIESTLTEKAKGNFRWVYCQLMELKKLKSLKPKYVERALFTLPTSLDSTYERMLTSIEAMYRTEALIALRWLAFAERPLTTTELLEACIVDSTGEGKVDLKNRGSIGGLLEVLGGLLVLENAEAFDEDAELDKDVPLDKMAIYFQIEPWLWHEHRDCPKIRLAHFSVKEYLISERILRGEAKEFYLSLTVEHGNLAEACLVYLQFYSDRKVERPSARSFHEFPLLWYTSRFWPSHTKQRGQRHGREISFLRSEKNRSDWAASTFRDPKMGTAWKANGSALATASFLGLEHVVHEMLLDTENPDTRTARPENPNNEFNSALCRAAGEGHVDVVEELLQAGADVNGEGVNLGTALQAASCCGQIVVVEVLLKHGAEVDRTTRIEKMTALQIASRNGYLDLVILLVQKGAKNTIGVSSDEAFCLAATNFSTNLATACREIAEFLLESAEEFHERLSLLGRDLLIAALKPRINLLQAYAHQYPRGEPLLVGEMVDTLQVIMEENEQVRKLLLRRKDERDAIADEYNILLKAAAHCGLLGTVQSLIDRGADINAVLEERHGTALQVASAQGHISVVKLLVREGVNVEGKALLEALERGHTEVAQSLIEKGADCNTRGYRGSALELACEGGHQELVQTLIDKGAHVNAQGGGPGNALPSAFDHPMIMKTLIENGANVNFLEGIYRNLNGGSLQFASWVGRCSDVQPEVERAEVVQTLIDNGADVNATGGWYGSALQAARVQGLAAIADVLIRNGASVDDHTTNLIGMGILHLAAAEGNLDMLNLALDNDLCIDAPDNAGWTPLHWAARCGWEDIVRTLCLRGANIKLQDWQGWTARRLARFVGHKKVAGLLKHFGSADEPSTGTIAFAPNEEWCSFCKMMVPEGNIFHCSVSGNDQWFWLCFRCHKDAALVLSASPSSVCTRAVETR